MTSSTTNNIASLPTEAEYEAYLAEQEAEYLRKYLEHEAKLEAEREEEIERALADREDARLDARAMSPDGIALYDAETGQYIATVPPQTAQRIYRHECLLASLAELEKAASLADCRIIDDVYEAYQEVCEAMIAYLYGYEQEYDYSVPDCDVAEAIMRAVH